MLGDRWTLLVVRDLMVRGLTTFKQFQESGEGIATNILAARLRSLRDSGIVTTEPDRADGRSLRYRLTEKGIALAPLVFELLLWGARYEKTGAPPAMIDAIAANREATLAETHRRWRDRDPMPLIPKFDKAAIARLSKRQGAHP